MLDDPNSPRLVAIVDLDSGSVDLPVASDIKAEVAVAVGVDGDTGNRVGVCVCVGVGVAVRKVVVGVGDTRRCGQRSVEGKRSKSRKHTSQVEGVYGLRV